jgi:hypothetical protein
MNKKFIFFVLAFIFATTLHAQSPYGKVLTLDNSGAQQWIDIGTVLSNYITYHIGSNSPAWLTNGNSITSGVFLGTTNNQPLIFKTNDIERIRLTETGELGIGIPPSERLDVNGNIKFVGALMPNGSAGTSGQVLTSQGSGTPPVWTNITYTETDPNYMSWIDATGSTSYQILRFNGTKYTPISTGDLTTTTSGVTITGGTNAVIGTGTSINIATANGTTTGLLSSTDWTSFNNKENALTFNTPLSRTVNTISIPQANGTTDGYLSSTDWTSFNNKWSLTGNSLSGTEKFGSTNNQSILIITDNTDRFRLTTKGQIEVLNSGQSVFIGEGAGNSQNNSSDRYNVFIGYNSGISNVTGDRNVGIGYHALYSSTAGRYNVAIGFQTLFSNTQNGNSAVGYRALRNNTTGYDNTGIGKQTLANNNIGYLNTAVGSDALLSNTTGNENVAIGSLSLVSNSLGSSNTAIGAYSLYNSNTSHNTAIGYFTLYATTGGSYNTTIGSLSLANNTTGFNNTAIGALSLGGNLVGKNNTAVGMYSLANSLGDQNTALGYDAGSIFTSGNNNIFIGYNAQPSSPAVNNEVTIGNSNNNSYRMYAASWTNASDARYKHDIEQLPFGLDFILQLKPRQYVYNNSTDGKITMGFVAQEVQEVMRHFGMVDKFNLVKPLEKDFLGLNTTEIIPILVKAVQEQQQTIEQMRTENEQMRAENEALKQRLERLEKYVFERTGSGDNNVGMK